MRRTNPTLQSTEDRSTLAQTIDGHEDRERLSVQLGPGDRIGRFEIQRELGRGGMGVVYQANDERVGRTIALKLLHPRVASQGQARFRREAEGLAKLSHPNVVQIYDTGRIDGRIYIAMERVEGETLDAWQRRSPPWTECVDAYVQAARGLAAAHAKGLIHRDFKPSNCIIDESGRVRVLDFGLVYEPDTEPLSDEPGGDDPTQTGVNALAQSLTRAGAIVGTPAYMPLELLSSCPASTRSDQFSLCASLYEALYGQHPFEWSNLYQLTLALERGRVRPAPPTTRVPSPIWTILSRGLHRDPEARWPSMNALIKSLEAARRPRSAARWWGLLGVAGLGVGLWAVSPSPPPAAPPSSTCAAPERMLEGVWDSTLQARVTEALEATGAPHARQTARRVRSILDDYAARWSEAYGSACEDPHPTLPLRCLEGLRSRLRATSTMLADADVDVAREAIRAAGELPAVKRCTDPAYLRAQLPVPEDPQRVAEVDALREELTQIRALYSAGRYEQGLARIESTMASARTLGFEPLIAELNLDMGLLFFEAGRYPEAIESLTAAYFEAGRWDAGAIRAQAALSLAAILGKQQAEYDEARRWRQHASAEIERLGDDRLHTRLLATEGSILNKEGKYDAARAKFREALARLDVDEPGTSDARGRIHHYIGVALDRQGHYEEAAAEFRQSKAHREQALGPEHPHLGDTYNSLGNVYIAQGHIEEALDQYRTALSLWEPNLAPNHPDVIQVRSNIAVALGHLGRYPEALVEFRRVLAIRIETLGPEHPDVAASHDNVGVVLRITGDYDAALVEHRKALAIETGRLEPGHPDLGYSHNNIAGVLLAQRRYEDAEAEFRVARQIWSAALGPDHPTLLTVLSGLVDIQLVDERYDEAVADAEQALAITQNNEVSPRVVTGGRFLLARALWARGDARDRDRARALAEQARDFYKGPGHSDPERLAEIEQALAEHQ